MSEFRSHNVEIYSPEANLAQMVAAVAAQTGDPDPFFCPKVHEGEPYRGHAHTSPPTGVTNPSDQPIHLE